MAPLEHRSSGLDGERGQAVLLVLGMLAALLVGVLILFGFGQALGARGKHQRAADLAAVSAAQVMRRHHSRLFEPAVFEDGRPNPRHLSDAGYLAYARAAALRGARNGVPPGRVAVEFPDASFAATQVKLTVYGATEVALDDRGVSGSTCAPPRRRRSRPTSRPRTACPPTAAAAATTVRWPTGWASPSLISLPLRKVPCRFGKRASP